MAVLGLVQVGLREKRCLVETALGHQCPALTTNRVVRYDDSGFRHSWPVCIPHMQRGEFNVEWTD